MKKYSKTSYDTMQDEANFYNGSQLLPGKTGSGKADTALEAPGTPGPRLNWSGGKTDFIEIAEGFYDVARINKGDMDLNGRPGWLKKRWCIRLSWPLAEMEGHKRTGKSRCDDHAAAVANEWLNKRDEFRCPPRRVRSFFTVWVFIPQMPVLWLGVLLCLAAANVAIIIYKRLKDRQKKIIGTMLREHRFVGNCARFKLSRREVEVLRLILEAKTYKEIAEQLFIAEKTVDSHMQHIYAKVGVHNKIALLKQMYS